MAKYNELTQAQIDEICLVYDECKNQLKVAKITKHSLATVSKYLIANGRGCGQGNNQHYVITDEQILQGIADGLTRQEIADKYNTHVENLAKRMRKLGVHAKYAKRKYSQKEKLIIDWHYDFASENFVNKHLGHNFEFISRKKNTYKIKCKKCGEIFERNHTTIRRETVFCKNCKKQEQTLENERIKLVRSFYIVKPRKCECCDKEFYSPYSTTLYCSETCKRKAKRIRYKDKYPERVKEKKKKYNDHGHHIHRAKQYGCDYEYGITLKKVIKRDNNICQICHKPCDINDKEYGMTGKLYPSIDHIIPLSKGGSHTWDNVQLAHLICNSYKRDLFTV